MRENFAKKLKFFRPGAEGVALCLLLSLTSSALAESVNQNAAYLQTDQKNRVASDGSMQHSTSYAMTALMDLGNLNIKSAVNNGMNAYGKYRNSETLDKLGDINYNQANAMSALGSSSAAPRKTETTFRRLDPAFLRQGEFNQVATEFEKKSGMPRETFLSQMSEISEKKIKRSDPQLVDKVLGRFEGFIAKIPNKDFRENLQKGVNMVPDSMRTGIISKAVAKFSNVMVGGISAPTAPGAATAANAGAAAGGAAGTGEAPVLAAAPEAEAPAGEPAEGAVAEATAQESIDRAPASDPANPLGNIIQAAIDTQAQDPTIFQIVTRRYRILTPSIAIR